MAKQWNFIQISVSLDWRTNSILDSPISQEVFVNTIICPINSQVNNSFLLEVEEIIRALEETNQSLLYPVVIIWVSLHGDIAGLSCHAAV